MAGRHGLRRHHRVPAAIEYIHGARTPPARPDPCGRSGQRCQDDAAHRAARRGRAGHHRLLPQRRRARLLTVPPLSRRTRRGGQGIFDNAVVDKILPLADNLPARLEQVSTSPTSGAAPATPSTCWRRHSPRADAPDTTSLPRPYEPVRPRRRSLDLPNVTFKAQDLAQLDIAEAFDAILVFDAIHDQAQPVQGAGQHPSGPPARRGCS